MMTALIACGIIGIVLIIWGMNTYDSDWPLGAGVFLFVGAVIGLAIMASTADHANDQRLLNQCLADGKKEYECVGLLRRDDPVVVPVVVVH